MRVFSIIAGAVAVSLGFASAPAQAQASRPATYRPPLDSEAPIAMLVDLSSGQVLHQRNPDRRFMPASITKVMTAFLAFELLEQEKLQLDQRFTFAPASFKVWGNNGSTMFLSANDELSVSDLLLGINTVSANDAAVVLGEGAAGSLGGWTKLMNVKAAEIGMTQSHFGTPNGLPDEGRTFVTARDLVTLATALIEQHPDLYARYFGHRRLTYRGITQANHEPFTGFVRGADGIKTGFTNEAGFGVLGSATRDGRRLVVVVAGSDRARMRDRAARSYLEWGFRAFDSRPLFDEGAKVGSAKVQDGDRRSLSLVAGNNIAAAMPRGTNRPISLAIHYEGPLRAPIMKGQRVAELEIRVDGMPPSRVPLIAGEDVKVAGPLDRLVNGFAGWLS
ncbi:D-alanyl-D-alanine carboxypeptidase family protein [Altererythrobacter sp. Z27]|uniref:D-alanyl-D-alanine carboxypeptidase family protein n=1 Tax=Altererythrobacter sp. Z27 TaxID=3461147 RepID=UPI004045175A